MRPAERDSAAWRNTLDAEVFTAFPWGPAAAGARADALDLRCRIGGADWLFSLGLPASGQTSI